jgi:2-oxoglutarate/2-oxoacid ferredoxin oxidoreductase subunit beta
MEATAMFDFVPIRREITTEYEEGTAETLEMHDGSLIRLRKLATDWDPLDRFSAINAMQRSKHKGEILTGLLYVDPNSQDLHDILGTTDRPLNSLRESDLCPGNSALEAINAGLR